MSTTPTTFYFVMDMDFVTTLPDTEHDFDEFTTRVMDELCKLETVDSGIIDPDITASLTQRCLSVLMGVEADSRRDARRLFSANVRTALHVAGCGTKGWPAFPDELPTPQEPEYATA
jgi:hypothetical protein